MRTQQEQITELYQRVTALELAAEQPRKPWWAMKGVLGPLASGASTVGLVIGYIQNWPADLMAALAAVAGGGSVTGIIGRLQKEAQPVAIKGANVPRGGAVAPRMAVLASCATLCGLVAYPAPTQAMTRVTIETTHYDTHGKPTHTTTERVTRKIAEARERREMLKQLTEARKSEMDMLGRALPPAIDDPTKLDPQAQREYFEWGRSAPIALIAIRQAEALDPEDTSALEVAKDIELANTNKGLKWAQVILGTPGGAMLLDRGFDWLQGIDPNEGGWGGEGGIYIANVGHTLKDGGSDGRASGGEAEYSSGGGGGGSNTSMDYSNINLTINNRSANQQSWDSSFTPSDMNFVPQGYNQFSVGEGGAFESSTQDSHGLNLSPSAF